MGTWQRVGCHAYCCERCENVQHVAADETDEAAGDAGDDGDHDAPGLPGALHVHEDETYVGPHLQCPHRSSMQRKMTNPVETNATAQGDRAGGSD